MNYLFVESGLTEKFADGVYGGIGMDNRINFSQEELQLLYAACMSYGGRLSDILKSIPNERKDITGGLSDRADDSWKLARKITGYMTE